MMSHAVSGQNAISLQEVQRSLALVQGWVERQGYRGYEPFE